MISRTKYVSRPVNIDGLPISDVIDELKALSNNMVDPYLNIEIDRSYYDSYEVTTTVNGQVPRPEEEIKAEEERLEKEKQRKAAQTRERRRQAESTERALWERLKKKYGG